MTYDFL